MSTNTSLNFTDDPYEKYLEDQTKSKNLIKNDRSSKFSRKFNRFKQQLKMKKTYFFYGGLQGFAIGLLSGLGIGIVTAIQTKRLIFIPITMVGSAVFFSGVMAFGSLIRSADAQFMEGRKRLEEGTGYECLLISEQLKEINSRIVTKQEL